jgi:hypothetical protein
MSTAETWSDPTRCPFCEEELASPGAGFYDHIHDSETCQTRHERWTERLTDDIRGGWSG